MTDKQIKKIEAIVKKIGFEKDEVFSRGKFKKGTDTTVTIDNSFDIEIISIKEHSSRGSNMYRLDTGNWLFNRNFWLTPNNLKIINEIEKVLKDE